MVGNIAARYLTPEAARQVAVLLRDDRLADRELSGRKTLGEIAYWADEIKDYPWGRRLGQWHFDDIPLCGEADYARYCPGGHAPRHRLRATSICSRTGPCRPTGRTRR